MIALHGGNRVVIVRYLFLANFNCNMLIITRNARTNFRHFSVDRIIHPQSKEFYHNEGLKRFYFYVIDTRGQLFLEETPKRNIATCMKDISFLNFTFTHLRPNTTPHYPNIPLISKCGREVNFISPLDRHSVLGFKDLVPTKTGYELMYGGNLSQPFNPEYLKYSPESGRMYHLLTDHKYCKNMLGLLHPHICQTYAKNIEELATHDFRFEWQGQKYALECMDMIEERDEDTV